MSKNGSRGAKFARAVALGEQSAFRLQAGTHNRKARRLLALEQRRKQRFPVTRYCEHCGAAQPCDRGKGGLE